MLSDNLIVLTRSSALLAHISLRVATFVPDYPDLYLDHLALYGLIEHCPSMHVAHGNLCVLASPGISVAMIAFGGITDSR